MSLNCVKRNEKQTKNCLVESQSCLTGLIQEAKRGESVLKRLAGQTQDIGSAVAEKFSPIYLMDITPIPSSVAMLGCIDIWLWYLHTYL